MLKKNSILLVYKLINKILYNYSLTIKHKKDLNFYKKQVQKNYLTALFLTF